MSPPPLRGRTKVGGRDKEASTFAPTPCLRRERLPVRCTQTGCGRQAALPRRGGGKGFSAVIGLVLVAILTASPAEAQIKGLFLVPADLVVDSASLSDPSPRPGETVHVNAVIKNIGGLNLSGSIVVKAKPSVPHKSPPQADTNNLNAGQSRTVAVKYAVPSTAKNGDNICFEVSVSSASEPSSRWGNNTLAMGPCLKVEAPLAISPFIKVPPSPSPGAGAAPALDLGKVLLPAGKADLKIAAVKSNPAKAVIFPPKGLLTLSAAVANIGGTTAENAKLLFSVAKKPQSGAPAWKTPGEIGFKGPANVSIGEIEPGRSETTEVELSATGKTKPGTYLFRLQAVASGATASLKGTYQGEFRVGYVKVPPRLLQGKDLTTVKLPPWALVGPYGIGDAPVAGEEDWGGWGDWGDWGGGDWGGGDWGDWSGDWGTGEIGATPPAGPIRTPGSVGEGSSRGMELAELKPQPETQAEKFVPNRVVLFALPKGSESAEAILKIVASRYALSLVELTKLESVGGAMGVYKIVGRREVMDVVGKIQQDGRVLAQPNLIFEALAADPKAGLQYGPAMLGVPRLKGRLTGKGVKIALLDTGVDAGHEDLQGRVAGFQDMVKGGSKPSPDLHGTAVAGIIAALADNGKGIAGVAPGASLVVIKVIEPRSAGSLEGTSTTDRIVKGLDTAIGSGARVINLSIGGPKDEIVGRIVDAALKKNIVVVAAAGNGGPQGRAPYPATYPGVIAVTAIDKETKPYSAANQGDYISLSAPGVEVLTTAPGSQYRLVSGTSFAAAHVSGVAALLLEANPGLSGEAVRKAIEAGSVDIGAPGKDPQTGRGRVSVCKALRTATNKEMCAGE